MTTITYSPDMFPPEGGHSPDAWPTLLALMDALVARRIRKMVVRAGQDVSASEDIVQDVCFVLLTLDAAPLRRCTSEEHPRRLAFLRKTLLRAAYACLRRRLGTEPPAAERLDPDFDFPETCPVSEWECQARNEECMCILNDEESRKWEILQLPSDAPGLPSKRTLGRWQKELIARCASVFRGETEQFWTISEEIVENPIFHAETPADSASLLVEGAKTQQASAVPTSS